MGRGPTYPARCHIPSHTLLQRQLHFSFGPSPLTLNTRIALTRSSSPPIIIWPVFPHLILNICYPKALPDIHNSQAIPGGDLNLYATACTFPPPASSVPMSSLLLNSPNLRALLASLLSCSFSIDSHDILMQRCRIQGGSGAWAPSENLQGGLSPRL